MFDADVDFAFIIDVVGIAWLRPVIVFPYTSIIAFK